MLETATIFLKTTIFHKSIAYGFETYIYSGQLRICFLASFNEE